MFGWQGPKGKAGVPGAAGKPGLPGLPGVDVSQEVTAAFSVAHTNSGGFLTSFI